MIEVPSSVVAAAAKPVASGLWGWVVRTYQSYRFVRTDRAKVWGWSRSHLLTDAAQMARDALVEHTHGRYAEGLAHDGDALSWYMHMLAMPDTADSYKFPGPLRLFGKRYQSTKVIEVPMSVRQSTHLARDDVHGTKLVDLSNKPPVFVELEVIRSEMLKRIEDAKIYGKDPGL